MADEKPTVALSDTSEKLTEVTAADVADATDKPAKADEEPGYDALTGSVCEIKALVERTKSGDVEVIEKDKYMSSLEKKPFEQFAIVLKQVLNEKGKQEKKIVQINSPQLLATLKAVVEYYPSESLDFSSQATYESPFELLYHHRSQLSDFKAKAEADDTTREHIDLLLHFLTCEAGDDGRDAEKLIDSGLCAFKNLWMVFRPGDLLLHSKYGQDRLYRLQQTGYHEDPCNGKYFELSCAFTSCDGADIGTGSENLHIFQKREFVGENAGQINGFSIVPLKFLPLDSQEEIKARLTARGEKYLTYRGVNSIDYDGLFLFLKTPPFDFYDERSNYDGTWLPRTACERVVLDPKTFVEEMRDQKESCCAFREDDKTRKLNCDTNCFTSVDADPLLCPPYIYGYSMELKLWCKFFVDNFSPVTWRPDPMEQLILPLAQRRLIKSLVTSHRFPDQARDEASLKGKGLIFLLHGAPGAGKTLTAELAAEQTRRPLLKISSGELGSWGVQISHELKKLLTYASTWQAIVLIDEADVFLEARDSGPDRFEQNNLVAVFLRQLEYFQGILFLTSNRVSVFDPAIRSRIHLALQYVSPDAERRRALWFQKLAEVPAEVLDIDGDEWVERVVEAPMNGREISNAVNTARTLATAEEGKMRVEHLEAVVGIWREFESSLAT
ncbi:P-loop containing nucleoside triphosphate hydrolase protein [Trichodelitschia bisporula]|uniref:P-loop containing nucleoside triphosphate hydrolase protein n=1 Tax=Trichodelitschia bisporula TaxID=703511 RepID=A0A6G1I4J4_9PEZI|nr:P-loop containing nucleoside triphosphate hydrolase protein [Trichodelitschia bisporula]